MGVPLKVELYWSRKAKMPSCNDHEGRVTKFNRHEIKPFNCDMSFIGEKMYMGVYSETGVNLRLGCSFGKDYFGAG